MNTIKRLAHKLGINEPIAYEAGFEDGFRKCRDLVVFELKNIAAQTEDPAVMAIVVRFEKFGEE